MAERAQYVLDILLTDGARREGGEAGLHQEHDRTRPEQVVRVILRSIAGHNLHNSNARVSRVSYLFVESGVVQARAAHEGRACHSKQGAYRLEGRESLSEPGGRGVGHGNWKGRRV